jgi:hypothetical protein
VFLSNGECAVEAKSKPGVRDVDGHVERTEKLMELECPEGFRPKEW